MRTGHLVVTYVLRTDALGQWLSITAIAVSALVAFATFRMASKTREMAKATESELDIGRRQATASENAVAAATRPWIVAAPETVTDDPDPDAEVPAVRLGDWDTETPVYSWIRLQNIGPGLALIDSANSWMSGYGQTNSPRSIERYANIFTDTPVVPSGGEFSMIGRIKAAGTDWSDISCLAFADLPIEGREHGLSEFVLEIAFADAANENRVTAKIHVRVEYRYRCHVFRIDYFRANSPEAFLVTRVGMPK